MTTRFSVAFLILAAASLGVMPSLGQAASSPHDSIAHTSYDVNPCMTPDPGWGAYDSWENVALGQMIAPQRGGVTRDGGFDLVVHFHGHEAIRKEFVKTGAGVVLVGIDLGIGSGAYEDTFADVSLLPRILASVEEHIKKRTGKTKVYVRHLALSSWSAGYGAIRQILRQPIAKKVDALVLLDSLHTDYKEASVHEVREPPLEPFLGFARAASEGRKFMFLSHSSIVPPGYASTTEVASYIVQSLGGKLQTAHRNDVLGLMMIDRFDKGAFHVRGYRGNDKPDHCANIGLMADVMQVHLVPRWKTPPGSERSGS